MRPDYRLLQQEGLVLPDFVDILDSHFCEASWKKLAAEYLREDGSGWWKEDLEAFLPLPCERRLLFQVRVVTVLHPAAPEDDADDASQGAGDWPSDHSVFGTSPSDTSWEEVEVEGVKTEYEEIEECD